MSDATSTVSSIDPFSAVSEVVSDPAAVLFGLEAEFSVAVTRVDAATVQVVIEQALGKGRAWRAGCSAAW